ncbi:MAG: hypothetical protein ACRD3W_19455 [Terriglobales bacterium]
MNAAQPVLNKAPANSINAVQDFARLLSTVKSNQNNQRPVIVDLDIPAPDVAPEAALPEAFIETGALPAAPPVDALPAPVLPERPTVGGETCVRYMGQIQELRVAGTWNREKDKAENAGNGLHQYILQSDKHARLCFFYRGNQLTRAATEAFRALLSKAPHLCDAFERHSVVEVLRDKTAAQSFTFTSIRTADINGRRVLLVEGTYDRWHLKTITMYVDSTRYRDLAAVQEVSFIAPRQTYYQQYANIVRAFQNIDWKG